jgi:hypothetical protein
MAHSVKTRNKSRDLRGDNGMKVLEQQIARCMTHSDSRKENVSPPTRPSRAGLVRDTEYTEGTLFFENREMTILEKRSCLGLKRDCEEQPFCLSVPPDKQKHGFLCGLCASVVKLVVSVTPGTFSDERWWPATPVETPPGWRRRGLPVP